MASVIQAEDLTLYELEKKFNCKAASASFFEEWLQASPVLSREEERTLKRVKNHYFNLNRRRPLLEDLVKMVVLSPLFDLAGFYSQDWEIRTEAKVECSLENEEETIRGYIDILIVKEQFWLLVIETKRTQINVLSAVPQILFYMLNRSKLQPTTFGFATNGLEFIFLKLIQAENPVYRTYALFLEREEELQQVLRGLKYLSQNLREDR